MLLVQDQYVQNSRKNFDTELQLKQNASKPVFSGSKEIWGLESGGEEEAITSGNDTDPDENFLFADPSDLPEEVFENRRAVNPRKKNVRFGSSDFNYVFETSETSSLDNEYLGDCGGYLEGSRRRPLSQDQEPGKEFCLTHKPKWRSSDYEHEKRPKSSPEYPEATEKRAMGLGEYARRIRRREHRCGRYHNEDFDDVVYRKPTHRAKYLDCGGDVTSRCCEFCVEKKNYAKMVPDHRHGYHVMKDSESEIKNPRRSHYDGHHAQTERYCFEDYHEHGYAGRTKKKTLEAVQEQQEQLSDSTYKVPCSKFSNQTITGEPSGFQKKRSSEKLTNSSISDWLYCGTKGNGSYLGEKFVPARIHKLRSRRTRMNKIKNGWKKALVQTVRDGNRNERVGVIVMGSKGPEFYAKNFKKPAGFVPFRKSKSFLDGPAKSFEVMTVDCKNVFLSSSEPGPRTNYINDLVCPEEDDRVEEKMARFSKNVNEIVKNSEEKFYKALSSSDYLEKKQKTEGMFKGAGEGTQEEENNLSNLEEKKEEIDKPKFSSFASLSFDTISPRAPKSFRGVEKKVNEESKAIADALNEQAKQYLESQSNPKEKNKLFEELKEKYPPKEISPETIDANLTLWGMKTVLEKQETEKEEKTEEKREEMSQTGSVKSTEQISLNKQRRKKYYETTTTTTSGKPEDDDDDLTSGKPQLDFGTPKRSGRSNKWEIPEGPKSPSNPDSKLISEVFRDLVENGCAISREESENLQSILHQGAYNPEVRSSSSSDVINTIREGKARSPKTPTSLGDAKRCGEEKEEKKGRNERAKICGESEGFLEELGSRKVMKMNCLEEKTSKKMQGKTREGKAKKKTVLEDRMKLLREALPSIAAENEAAHLKQLKKYIDKFIDRVEASTATELDKRKEIRGKSKEYASTDSSEVRVDARKILDFVSNPFKKISSDVTINIAKKLTDALVFESSKNFSTSTKARKHSENETNDDDDDAFDASSGSDRCEEPEPTYLKQLKKMRNEHLNNIVLEVKRLSELLRFLDRCNRLHF